MIKSVTLRDMNGNNVLKVSFRKGKYFYNTFTKGAREASVLLVTDDNKRIILSNRNALAKKQKETGG